MGTGRKLLLADDSITIQKVVNLTFADEGLDVTTVGNGDLAIEKIEEIAPDIVLVDVHMPGLNGYEVCEFVKRNERFRHIPVMLLVGSFEPFSEAEARRVGADDYLTKPFQSIRQLVSKVGALLSGKSYGDEIPTKELDELKDVANEAGGRGAAELAPDSSLTSASAIAVESAMDVSSDAFADPTLDDALIDARPAGNFNIDRTVGSAQHGTMQFSTADHDEIGVSGAESFAGFAQDTHEIYTGYDAGESLTVPGSIENQSTQSARAASLDDGLLELGDNEPQLARSGNDESVLDLGNDAPAETLSTSITTAESSIAHSDDDVPEISTSAVSVIEPEVVDDARIVEATPSHEQTPEAVSVEPVVEGDAGPQPHKGLITLDQLSPEVIDAIARRAVEQLSERVVEQIAWEVVPDLAERLIKRRLEEEKQ